jgi:2-polyprenyl-3-methyl-5-hydroxy-6-metoxy-1,4-benzoquinol methylase
MTLPITLRSSFPASALLRLRSTEREISYDYALNADPMVACRVCGSREIGLLQKSLCGSRFALLTCRSCRLEFLDPLPAPDDLRRIYSAEYYRSWGMAEGGNPAVDAMKKLTFAGHLRRLRDHIGAGDLLDIGTATGLLLEVAREQGFEPYGIEISDYAAGLAAAKFGAGRIHHGTLQTAPFGDGRFSAITMTDLLEHVADPLDTLMRVRQLLRPDGIVLITTPNTASLTRLAMGAKWTHYKVEHLYYLNPRSMAMLAERAGFQVLSIRPASKAITLSYLRDQFRVYRHPVLTPAAELLAAIFRPLRHAPLRLRTGESLILLRKARDTPQ